MAAQGEAGKRQVKDPKVGLTTVQGIPGEPGVGRGSLLQFCFSRSKCKNVRKN
jgi:hypothetical protein